MSRPADTSTPFVAVLPLAAVTGTALLATDLYLPSIPSLPLWLGGTYLQAQLTLPAFFATFAAALLLYGALAEAYGRLHILLVGMSIFLAGSLLGGLAPDIETLLVARGLQGAGAAAAPAVIPALIRGIGDQATSIRALSWLGICQSVVPALGPVLGAGVLAVWGWRANFGLLVIAGVACLWALLRRRATFRGARTMERSQGAAPHGLWSTYALVLSRPRFLGLALSYACAYGTMLTFVGSAPFLLQRVYGHGAWSLGVVQAAMVACFMAGAMPAARVVGRHGARRAIRLANLLFGTTTASLLVVAFDGVPSTAWTATLAMLPSQIGLGLRSGVSKQAAMDSVPEHPSGASAMASFLCFALAVAGNAAVSAFLATPVQAVALVCLILFLACACASLLAWHPLRTADSCVEIPR
ncbi:MFS transporter [Xanthomonas citri]|uniref:MFS transporter n=1 Tax=Xanthomonas citri TaxID=346 RepID=UPI0001CED09D|nr:MFS transporter [Xanthomonas citri]AMV05965.1 multidrug transporter [Xanthomonas citri pv. aurantifolii]ARE58083.1 multidrug transporter [Xanthomonas citri pv. aurantifolii]EFF42897.1 drug resistance transporter, Bcr/CflA family protein [Xanthomonas citri pv. aurantifolii str. ICPB 11122]